MKRFILSHKYKKSESSGGSGSGSVSDLVALKILPKQVSEFTSDDIGTIISIPYTDPTGKILLNDGNRNDGNIEFEVVGVNHHTSAAHQQTITLMTKHIIRYVAFDAKEPNNPNPDRRDFGNNRWSVSNIRQWLNSNEAASEWFKPQHDYDESPTTDKVSWTSYNGTAGVYAGDPGFLAGFSEEVLQHLTVITNITAKPAADGGSSETTEDKVFLPSLTEMGFGNNNGIDEGTALSKFTDNTSRIKTDLLGLYWLRSHETASATKVRCIADDGSAIYDGSTVSGEADDCGFGGIAPIIVIH